MNDKSQVVNQRVLSMLGLAMKAGKLAAGEFAAERSVRDQQACLMILAGDASGNTRKKFENMCVHHTVPVVYLADKETLGKAMGKEYRSCVAVNDPGFAMQLQKLMNQL